MKDPQSFEKKRTVILIILLIIEAVMLAWLNRLAGDTNL
jgi:hypothetical protein